MADEAGQPAGDAWGDEAPPKRRCQPNAPTRTGYLAATSSSTGGSIGLQLPHGAGRGQARLPCCLGFL